MLVHAAAVGVVSVLAGQDTFHCCIGKNGFNMHHAVALHGMLPHTTGYNDDDFLAAICLQMLSIYMAGDSSSGSPVHDIRWLVDRDAFTRLFHQVYACRVAMYLRRIIVTVYRMKALA